MIFNGLAKSDLVVFNALNECDLSKPVPVSKLIRLTCYEERAIRRALTRLVDYQIITRHRAGRGYPYTYQIRRNGYAVLDT
jgi:RIO-like serine/threonine protein kinase